jgi:hypothetical protein
MLGNKKPEPRCQCMNAATDKPCRKIAKFGSLFCAEHANCPMSPLSGYEPRYQPEKWNNDPAIYKSMNCYAYAFNFMNPSLIEECRKNGGKDCRKFFPQPGALNGDRNALSASERLNCEVVSKLMKADVPDLKDSSFYEKCPPGYSKIGLTNALKKDYHYYKQDEDGFWSHKDGSNKVKRFDALRRRIFNPEAAARDYRWQGSDLNYSDFCGFYCAPRDRPVLLGQGGERLTSAAHVAGARRPTRKAARVGRSTRKGKIRKAMDGGVHPRYQTRRHLRSGLPW